MPVIRMLKRESVRLKQKATQHAKSVFIDING